MVDEGLAVVGGFHLLEGAVGFYPEELWVKRGGVLYAWEEKYLSTRRDNI